VDGGIVAAGAWFATHPFGENRANNPE
jgi:hypothetical protein